MRGFNALFIGTFSALVLVNATRADILVGTDGRLIDGKITSSTDREIVIQGEAGDTRHIDRGAIARVVYADGHGAVAPATQPAGSAPPRARWEVPTEPVAPPAPKVRQPGPTYYVIPLHGEVGSTVLAGALEKSLDDAIQRKATCIVLDIQSPGGMVDESLKIVKVLAHYNKLARIVALTDQDLSAAAIFTLSVKTIYVKPTSMIGAARAFIPSNPELSAKVEEKMNSAWRAAARNSAEEGGHDPLLADAMIDTNMELHIERQDGKAVIKEGPGDKMICRKGQILTLTSHEAVNCGLAAGSAEDAAELGKLLGFADWTECAGLGTVLAEYLPKRDAAFQTQMKKLTADFRENIDKAKSADLSQETTYVQIFPHAPTHIRPVPGHPMIPRGPQFQPQQQRVVRVQNTKDWKQRSLGCVVALQQSEANLRDIIDLCRAFEQTTVADAVNETLTKIGTLRGQIYDERNKYGAQEPVASNSNPNPGHPAIENRPPKTRNNRAPDPVANAPAPAESEARLKQIEAGWKPVKEAAADAMAGLKGLRAIQNGDRSILVSRGGNITTANMFRPPVTFHIVAMTDVRDTRIGYGAQQIIFNWEMNHEELRVDGGPPNGAHKPGAGLLPARQWVGIELTVRADEMIIFIDGMEKHRIKADFSNVNEPLRLFAHGGDLWIKSITAAQPRRNPETGQFCTVAYVPAIRVRVIEATVDYTVPIAVRLAAHLWASS